MFSEYNMSSYVFGYGADGVLRTAADLQGKGLRNGDLPENVSPEWAETQEANEIARIRVKGKLQYLNVDLPTKP